MPYFNIVAQTTENKVVMEYEPVIRKAKYQRVATVGNGAHSMLRNRAIPI